MEKGRHTRRDFLKKTGGAAAGLISLSLFGVSCNAKTETVAKSGAGVARASRGKSGSGATVVVARDAKVWNDKKLDQQRLRELLFKAVRTLNGGGSDEQAWKTFFDPGDSVGIKVNCIAGRNLSTTPELVAGIIAGLRLAGVGDGNIIVWDRTTQELKNAGFRAQQNEGDVRFMGTDTLGLDYDEELSQSGDAAMRVSRIASTLSTALISASVLKDHDLAGLSGCLKNYFGAINNPNKLHTDGCNPGVAECYSLPVFKNKTRLCICDATLAQYHGGPGYKRAYTWKFGGVLVSDDPVALDAVAASIINAKRREKGMKTLDEDGRPPKYITTAASASHSLGVADLSKIKLVNISL